MLVFELNDETKAAFAELGKSIQTDIDKVSAMMDQFDDIAHFLFSLSEMAYQKGEKWDVVADMLALTADKADALGLTK